MTPSSTIVIVGSSFGASAQTGSVTVSGTPAIVLRWSHTVVEVRSSVASGVLEMQVGGQRSNSIPDYSAASLMAPPLLSSLSITRGPPIGGYVVSATGKSLGVPMIENSGLYFGNVKCEPVLSHSPTNITCIVPPGAGRSGDCRRCMAAQLGHCFEYDPPVILGDISGDGMMTSWRSHCTHPRP